MSKLEEIDKLYFLYGFTKGRSTNNEIAYIYNLGYFHNVEIVYFNDEKYSDKIERYYHEAGFTCKNKLFSTVEELHNDLYNGFFDSKLLREKLNNEYRCFCKIQENILKNHYAYIETKYELNGNSDSESLIERLYNILIQKDPILVIIEASAGFGKTCTSYEFLHRIVNTKNSFSPIITELSRNRKASKFSYVLYDEMDRLFNSISLDLVKEEIIRGNIPIIIDGFDELITRSYDPGFDKMKDNEGFENIESMLDTIKDYLVGNAKIFLTSRKSAIFTGDKFDNWLNNLTNNFKIIRITLNEPCLTDWIGFEKYEYVQKNKVPIGNISNPVLLSFLRNISTDEFENYCKDIESIIEYYFKTLLEREMERQGLKISFYEQMIIFENLAYAMASSNISAEKRDVIRDYILEVNYELLNESLQRYPSTDRPDIESLANTLAGHVLLDRTVKLGKEAIGFINDFVFGTFLSEKIIKSSNVDILDFLYLNRAYSAFGIRIKDKRDSLFRNFRSFYDALIEKEKFDIDFTLNKETTRDYESISIENYTFDEFNFINKYKFVNCIFQECVFKNKAIYSSIFQGSTFFDCKFYNSKSVYDDKNQYHLVSCQGLDAVELSYTEDKPISIIEECVKRVLEQFWPKGKNYAQPKRTYKTLFAGNPPSHYKYIEKAIDRLREEKLIIKEGLLFSINYEKIKEIRAILGRDI